jgi:hypothetical protein
MAIDTEETTKKSVNSSKSAVSGEGNAASSKGSNNKVLKIVLIVVGVLIVLGIISSVAIGFAIKKGAETFIGAATGSSVKIDGDGDKITITGKDGSSITSSTSSSAELSKDFPKSDVPMYKGAKIEASSDMTIGSTKTYSVNLSTKDKVSSVISFYESEFSSGDWKKIFSTNSSDGSMLNFTSESKSMALTISVQNDEDEGNTAITLSIRVNGEDDQGQ